MSRHGVAQAAATLAEMFPRRQWVALATGEASNEHITGEGWPAKSVRTSRLGADHALGVVGVAVG
jgi:hypothetical protein